MSVDGRADTPLTSDASNAQAYRASTRPPLKQPGRLASGGRIDRSCPVRFRFDGHEFEGFAGDTLASALLANRVRIVGRSFKLHRPRGVFAAGCEEPNAIVDVGDGAWRVPNQKATQVELYDGLIARAVNCYPNARSDLFGLLQYVARVMPAGFYYKTFKWPNWHWFEPLIRKIAGLGRASALPDPDCYEERYEHCDVLVIGAGPSGLAAALAATRAGAKVVLADEHPVLGGALQWEERRIDGQPALEWVAAVEHELQASARATALKRASAFGYYDHNLVALCQTRERLGQALSGFDSQGKSGQERTHVEARERLWHVRATQVVLATGAIERPIVFPDNDVPGVMLASAALNYVVQYGIRIGNRAVLVTNSDSAYEVAAALYARGVTIAAIVDTRSASGEAADSARRLEIPVLLGYAPSRVLGQRAVRAIEVRPLATSTLDWGTGRSERFECDLVCLSGGWTPTVHLYSQGRGRLKYVKECAAFVPDEASATAPNALAAAGAAAGRMALHECLSDGFRAGREAARRAGATGDAGEPPRAAEGSARQSAFWASPRDKVQAQAWVDLQNDVTRQDFELAVRENLRSIEHVKRYTTCGMAVDQGKTSNMNALGILAGLVGPDISELGTTTFRPPYDPVTLGTLAARRLGGFYHPVRRTPLDRWHEEHAAAFEDFGGWRRPAWYARKGESREDCVRLEKRAARTAVSLFDGCSLGKIEVRGADAAAFLNRVYYNNMRSLATGQLRYGVMLNEHGNIIDDGVCARLAENHFLVSTTSGGLARIFAGFEEWLQCEWPDLRVLVTDVTSQWGNVTVAGPRARDLLVRLTSDIELSREDFPHMTVRCGRLEGVPVRIARVGFTGEMSYELNIPAGCAAALWELLMEEGQDLGVAPLGIEALQELRTEKGFFHVGTDTDGQTIPADLGMGATLERKTEDFIGRRSLNRPESQRRDRLQFVGIAANDPAIVLPVGAHVIADPKLVGESQGWVSSSCASEALGRGVALGLVRSGRRRFGETVYVYSRGEIWPAQLVSTAWYDPQGTRTAL